VFLCKIMENNTKSDKSDTLAERIKKEKERFLEAFEESIGIVTIACQKVGIHRSTYYDWLEKDPKFKKEVERIKTQQMGWVEDKLLQAIKDGNITAINFYLRCKHPEYKPRTEFSFDKESVDKTLDKIKEILE